MIEDRNLTVHTNDENFAREMAERIETMYLPNFDVFFQRLTSEVSLS